MESDSSVNPWTHLVVHLKMKCLFQKKFILLSIFHKDICRAVHIILLFEHFYEPLIIHRGFRFSPQSCLLMW